MNTDPRVQRFYDEAASAKKELRRIAMDIAAQRIEISDYPVFSMGRVSVNGSIIPDVSWALEHGRTDLAMRLIELADQYNNSMGTAAMMAARVAAERLDKSFKENIREGDLPQYLDDDGEDGEPIRLTGEEAAALFPKVED